MKEKRYIINPEEKVVVAMMNANTIDPDDTAGVADEVVEKCTSLTMYAVIELINRAVDCNMPNLDIPCDELYKGIAKCDEYDDFDPVLGKQIAGNKAEMKYHIAMSKKYKRLVDILGKAYEELYILECEHANKALKISNNIKKYTDK